MHVVEIVESAVARAVVAPSVAWCENNLSGGTWVEVNDPYTSQSAAAIYPRVGLASSLVQPLLIPGGTVFPASPTKIVDTADYAAWPYDLLNYDSGRGTLWFCHMQADDHVTGVSSVYYATINTTTDAVSTPVAIITDATYRCVAHSSCVAPNGDYLVWVMYRDKTTNATVSASIWRSTDGGANWSEDGDMVDGSDVSVGCLKPHGAFVTSAGTILVSDRTDSGSGSPYIHRSTDNGATWSAEIAVSNAVSGTDPLEPSFWQHPTSGRIISIYRAGESGSQPQALFSYSDNDGVTWAAMSEAPDWWQQYSNPCAIVYHSDDQLVEVFVGHRQYASLPPRLFRMLATPDDAASLTFGGMELIYRGTSTNNDFGYPSAVRVGSKVYLLWFDGGDVDADIYMAVGTRPA